MSSDRRLLGLGDLQAVLAVRGGDLLSTASTKPRWSAASSEAGVACSSASPRPRGRARLLELVGRAVVDAVAFGLGRDDLVEQLAGAALLAGLGVGLFPSPN